MRWILRNSYKFKSPDMMDIFLAEICACRTSTDFFREMTKSSVHLFINDGLFNNANTRFCTAFNFWDFFKFSNVCLISNNFLVWFNRRTHHFANPIHHIHLKNEEMLHNYQNLMGLMFYNCLTFHSILSQTPLLWLSSRLCASCIY